MKAIPCALEGVFLLEPVCHSDSRGFFMESYHAAALAAVAGDFAFVQDNHSLSEKAGVLRGLHFQLPPKAQTKLVRVTAGAVYDVVVDLRRSSPTFGRWAGFLLTASNKRQLLVPKGFAHGFCTLVPRTEFLYKVDEYYSPEHDRGIAWDDPDLGIDWPVANPLMSDKDRSLPRLRETGFTF
ncbi:dTDP-4-dehydrorhamnose 3,5-epimerase [Paenibacillus aurantius]|uniref:dTDP-4-dehydrorhamnose 3,5-epimerase n=1 Tax=Paenibacillus aurantius TaxID=2918900 RepID=A0AA96LGK6_9BACL|nr:dTDP-4-dehydrorhamnose 3,5-epimerase [Paenibacillus aurantius]WNQ12893.1 dTDP-4-dehydrorhamnose 3,5-epimerase [Paenibacillus aurantius]